MAIKVIHRDQPAARVPMISKDARFLVGPGTGAHAITMNYVILEPGEGNIPHSHPESEDVVFAIGGEGSAENHSTGQSSTFHAGETVFIPPGVVHAIVANRGQRIESVGGPTPPDLNMLRRAGIEI